MSKYTTEVRYICEVNAGLSESVGYNSVEDTITNSLNNIFDFSFPIFDENYRATLETKILRHYYTREIGFETVGLWKLKLCTKLNEIMPYYNKLYNSELLSFNPLYDVDLKTEYNKTHSGENERQDESNSVSSGQRENKNENETYRTDISNNKDVRTSKDEYTGDGHNTVNRNSNDWDLFNDTPQGSISNIKANSNQYLTNARNVSTENNETNINKVQNENNSTSSSEQIRSDEKTDISNGSNKEISANESSLENKSKEMISNIDEYIEHVSGKRGSVSYSKMLMEFRDSFLNIDMMIIEDLKDLFIYLW